MFVKLAAVNVVALLLAHCLVPFHHVSIPLVFLRWVTHLHRHANVRPAQIAARDRGLYRHSQFVVQRQEKHLAPVFNVRNRTAMPAMVLLKEHVHQINAILTGNVQCVYQVGILVARV